MKSFALKEYGSPAVFYEWSHAPKPLKETQVRIQIVAFGVNPYDTYLRQGKMQDVRPLKFPAVLGSDLAGIITEVGSAVHSFKVGDEVVAVVPLRAYSEEIVTAVTHVVKKPRSVAFTTAAALPTAGIAAYNLFYHMLENYLRQTIFIAGGTGSVGSLLTQLALQNNFQVFASGNSAHRSQLVALGLKPENYFPYDQEGAVPPAVDIFVDATKGSRGMALGLKILKENGTYIALNALPQETQQAQLPQAKFLPLGQDKSWSSTEALQELLQALGQKRLHLPLDEVLPFTLAGVKTAHEKIEKGANRGRIVVAR